ncbi:GTP 3',8-cyclase MoaA [Eubacterium sp. 1001713B170207_170306_E7]|uniref:GTP 3',8-cyclase MoaA n=1 Tax=Eubacterium sp. 1001713B170207_170306_E7 TaxID=2787097 RepID=UPI00189BAA29|nr:GTP 3',8-cyclase MoaA [Eubacterium sp. 1001713B170207_170306_E7]
MRDHFGRKVNYLRISITDLCNLRCVYCMPEQGVSKRRHATNLSFEEIEALVRAGVDMGIDKLRLTGGEPLVRAGVLELVKKIGAIPGIRDFAMTTNGILLPQMARELKAAGLRRVNISLDTLDPEKYARITRCGRLEDALAGIGAAVEAGLAPLKINTVLIRGFNDDEIKTFVDYTRKYPVEVRFIELMPLGEGADYAAHQYMPGDAVLERVPELAPLEAVPGAPARRFALPGAPGSVGLINPISHRFCSDCNRIRLTADGKLKPCLHSDEELDVAALRQAGRSYREILEMAVSAKPERHHIDECETIKKRNMNEIGG